MSKRNYIIERASDVNGGQYVQTNSSYNSGYEDGKKAGKEYCASEIEALRDQVEKLTKERIEYREKWLSEQSRNLSEEAEFEILSQQVVALEYLSVVDTSAIENLHEQLAALAEQNEKMRAFLEFAWKYIPMSEYAFEILEHAMNLPNLASPVLNKIKGNK